MTREDDKWRTILVEVRGFASDDIYEAFASVDAMAKATKGEKPMFHVSVRNPIGDDLTRAQWLHVADRIEAKLGLTDQPRGVTFDVHKETGDTHMHVGWSLIDDETMTLREVPFYKLRLKEVCRELERELGITQVRNEREGKTMAPTRAEAEQAYRLGFDPNEVRETIRDCWDRSDNGRSFEAALAYDDLVLAKGDRRDLVVVDEQGGVHALGKRILGVSAGEVRARCQDVDRESLPSVEQAKEQQRSGMRDEHAANLAWEDALADAAIFKEKALGQFAEPARFTMEQYEQLTPVVINDVTRNKATFTRFDIQRALEPHIEDKADRAGLARAILESPDVVHVNGGDGKLARYSTSDVIESERHALTNADALAQHQGHDVSRQSAGTSGDLGPERARALAHVLGPQGLAIIDGQAGTGKSSVLASARQVYETAGFHVVGLAHTNLVVQDLKQNGFAARTIDSELLALANDRTAWTRGTVVMVDEAAMVDTRRLGMIFAYAQASGAKVILAGDDRQFASIERGGLFEVLKSRYGAAELTEVHRQQTADERQASQMMAKGDFRGALATYDGKGAIHWSEQQSGAAQALVTKYMQDNAAEPDKSRFIFAYTNDEANQINAVVREARKARNELGESLSFETKHGKTEFAAGDRLQFTGTDKRRGIYNGQAGTVREIEGSRLTVDLDGRGKAAVTFDASEFQDFRHGYAGTIYRGQGRTIAETYLLHSEYWRSASSYVALTRHSEKTELFVARDTTADLPELARQMSRLDERRAASYYLPQPEREAKPSSPAEVSAWYASLDNYSRQLRAAAGSEQKDKSAEIRYDSPRREGVQIDQVLSDLERSDRSVRNAFAKVAGGLTSVPHSTVGAVRSAFADVASMVGGLASLLGQDKPEPARTPEEAQARRNSVTERFRENEIAAKKRSYGREIDTQARERGEREAEEIESQRRRRNERQR